MIQEIIKIILVEDNPADVALIERQIKKIITSPIIKVLDRLEDFMISVESFKPDVILCDYSLKGFNGFDILKLMNTYSLDNIPLIFVTGAINDEELAANSILAGASGYILKKNMNTLHEKLQPFFDKIVNQKNNVVVVDEKLAHIQELQKYLDKFKKENTINMTSYSEMKKSFDNLEKVLNKDND